MKQFLPLLLCSPLLFLQTNTVLAQLDESISSDEILPEVLTPARLKQARRDIPASVSIIDRQLIESSGYRQVYEIMRLVPGMSVGSRDGWNNVVAYHGTTFRSNRRMKVLVDGRSVYQPGIGTVHWSDIPISVDDIERIEVTRGPNAAAYGANAFLGVVNIITKHPLDSLGGKIKAIRGVGKGNGDIEDYHFQFAKQFSSGAMRISASSVHDSGFDGRFTPVVETVRDSINNHKINTTVVFSPDKDWKFDLRAGYKKGVNQESSADPFIISSLDHHVEDYYGQLKVTHSHNSNLETQVLASYNAQNSETPFSGAAPAIALTQELADLYDANPFYALAALTYQTPSGGSPQDDALLAIVETRRDQLDISNPGFTIAHANEDILQERYDLEIQTTAILSEKNKLAAGIDLRQDRVVSKTFFSGVADRDSFRIFSSWQNEWLPGFQSNIGGMYEKEESIGDDFSPRISLIYQPKPNHSFRAVYSEATRKPDLLEKQGQWMYTLRNITPPLDGITNTAEFFIQSAASGNIDSEKIKSQEMGYFSHYPDLHLSLDIKVFYEQFKRLISNTISLDDFAPVNRAHLEHSGFEIELDYKIPRKFRVHTAYAFIEGKSNERREEGLTNKHSLSTLMRYQFDHSLWLSTGIYFQKRHHEQLFKRLDLKLVKTIPWHNSAIELSGLIRHRLDDDGDIFDVNRYDEDTRIQLGISLNF